MKIKILIITLLSLTSFIFAQKEEPSEFFYINIDNSLNLNFINGVYSPFVGVGGRQIVGKNGIDWNTSIELYPLIRSKFKLFSYSINANYLRFLKAQRKNKFYIGAGLSFIGLTTSDYFYLLRSPSFLFGKQIYENNRIYIVQLKVNWPNHVALWIKERWYHLTKEERNKRLWSASIFVTTGVSF